MFALKKPITLKRNPQRRITSLL